MTSDPLISVIVPIYNVELYVLDCIKSIATQTYPNFEVILVNDGTPDRSAEICREWILNSEDNRFQLVDKQNGGLSDARNFGLKHCSDDSEYVVFVDSDDELIPDSLATLVKYASHNTLVLGTLLRCSKKNIPTLKKNIDDESNYQDIWHNSEFLSLLKKGIINSCCCNCYSLRIIRQYDFSFKKLLPEDTFFNFEYLSIITRVTIIRRPLYLYFIWGNTMSANPKEEIYTNYMILQQLIYSKVDEKDYNMVDQFVYPQYRVNSMNFIHKGEYTLPQKYLGMDLIRKSWDSYKPVSFPDRVLHFCLRHRLFKIAKFF